MMKDQESEQTLCRETVARHSQSDICSLTGDQIPARVRALGEAGMRYWLQIMKIGHVIYCQEKAFHNFHAQARRPGDPDPEISLHGQ
jgi:hypothetical protein